MCLRWSDVFPEISEVNSYKHLQELALEIDKALNTDAGRSNASRHCVHNIIIIKGKLIYGYHQSDEDFLKIYFYNPNDVFRTIDLLTKSKVLQKSIQPCYAHIPFRLQGDIQGRRFKECRESIEDNESVGRPSTSRNAENVALVSESVRKDRLQTLATLLKDVIEEMHSSYMASVPAE
ncbi:DNA polymerase zeta catalytic subunit [Trichonephila clavipes]|nr:DNA polymerase zeta catalytic subunit [Trichonephila clavipes]